MRMSQWRLLAILKEKIISETVKGKVPRPRKKTYLFLEQINMFAFSEEYTGFIATRHASVATFMVGSF